ncbi:MAG: hypothetical protein O7C62_09005 [Rickettsia endosymbiont of Ixodes persulcatus]|nr:hypothetical protein [Rickettsia endosymbiont of Ixodes persulcatus]
MYSIVSEWSSRYALDNADKNKIAHAVYEEHSSLEGYQLETQYQMIQQDILVQL